MQGGGGSTPDVTTYTTLIRILSTLQHPQQVQSAGGASRRGEH